MKSAHFIDGLLCRPAIEGDTVGGDEHAAAISAEPTMDEYFALGALANEGEKLSDLFVFRSRPAGAGQINEAHAEGFGALALILDQATEFAAEIDNGVDAEFSKLFYSALFRLSAAVQEIIDLAKVGNAGDIDFLCEMQLFSLWGGVMPSATA